MRFHAPSLVTHFMFGSSHPQHTRFGVPTLRDPKTALGVMGRAPSPSPSPQVPAMGRDVPREPLHDGGTARAAGGQLCTVTALQSPSSVVAKLLPQTVLAFFSRAANAGPSIVPSACAALVLLAEPQRALPWCHPVPGCGARPCTTAVHALKLQAWPNGFH